MFENTFKNVTSHTRTRIEEKIKINKFGLKKIGKSLGKIKSYDPNLLG